MSRKHTPMFIEREGAVNHTNESEAAHTPMFIEREGAVNHTNESEAAHTPMFIEREGAGKHTIECVTGVKTNPHIISENSEPGEKAANPDNGTSGRKPGYITANSYTYPLIKNYRNDLKDHQTEAELVLLEFLRNKKNRS